jgi:hypothetical protein
MPRLLLFVFNYILLLENTERNFAAKSGVSPLAAPTQSATEPERRLGSSLCWGLSCVWQWDLSFQR